MKVVLISKFFSFSGGLGIISYKTTSLLKENGHEVYFFASNKKPYFEENYEYDKYFPKFMDYSSLSFISLLKNIPKAFYNFEAEQKLDEFLKEIKPDLVHVNTILYTLTPSILNACYKNKIPMVMTLHDTCLSCPAMALMLNSETYCKNKLCIKGNSLHCAINRCYDKSLPKSIMAAAEFLFTKIHRLYERIDYFICPSKAMLELAEESGIKKEKLVLINNFVDDEMFNRQPEYSNKGYFLYVGRLGKEKGIKYLLEAMSKNLDIKLHIVGNGPEENNLKAYAKELSLNNVEFLGFKEGNELEEQYKGCISTILPSDCFEVFGLTSVESFIYGKPVIASNIGGIPEVVEDEVNGLLFDAGNVDELSDAIRKLYQNNNMVIEMGKNGREKAERLYNSHIYYDNLTGVYNKALNK